MYIKDKNNQTIELLPSRAIGYNRNSDKAAYLIPYGGTPDNPEFLYPEELSASKVKAFNSDEDYNKYLGDQGGQIVSSGISNFGQKFAPILAGSFIAPYAITGGIQLYSNPFVRTGLDILGSVDGIRNTYSDNGIAKTIRLAKEGDVWGAVKSGIGDVLDIVSVGDLYSATKIITKNPITGGFERQLVVSPAQSSGGRYTFYERPSKLTLAERMGIPKGERNNGQILLSMQDLVPQKFISVPGLKPIGGKMIADKVANHPHIVDRTKRLQQTYKRIIDPDYIPNNNWRKSRDTSPGMKIVDDIDVVNTNSPTGTVENIGGYYNPSEDVAYVRRRGTLDAQASTAFHENLHGYDFGRDEINDWIIKHLIDPEKVKGMSPRAQKYYLGSREAPIHAIQQGFNKGLDIGAPYPGDAAFDELLNSGIGGSLYYFKTQTPKDKRRLWRAMTGDVFVKKQGGKIDLPTTTDYLKYFNYNLTNND